LTWACGLPWGLQFAVLGRWTYVARIRSGRAVATAVIHTYPPKLPWARVRHDHSRAWGASTAQPPLFGLWPRPMLPKINDPPSDLPHEISVSPGVAPVNPRRATTPHSMTRARGMHWQQLDRQCTPKQSAAEVERCAGRATSPLIAGAHHDASRWPTSSREISPPAWEGESTWEGGVSFSLPGKVA